jgi:hypothetical protein
MHHVVTLVALVAGGNFRICWIGRVSWASAHAGCPMRYEVPSQHIEDAEERAEDD